MKYGFIKTAAATPKIRVTDCKYNAKAIVEQAETASKFSTALIVFPELCITGYTCSDLFLQSTLLKSAEEAVEYVCKNTEGLDEIIVIGAPIACNSSLYNCAVVIYKGKILGIVPKINIPNYSEFYEVRHFASGNNICKKINYAGQNDILLTSNQIFRCKNITEFTFAVEICEDLWVPNSPSLKLALGGAAIICNLSSSDDLIGKAEYRRDLVKMQSGKLCCGYVYCDSGFGESTTDMVFSGQNIICENATILSESERFKQEIIYGDIDISKLWSERRRSNTYIGNEEDINFVDFDMEKRTTNLFRKFSDSPFVPGAKDDLDSRCQEILTIQATGLATRLAHTKINNVVLGLSGGLDSTLALIVCVHAFDMLGLDRKNIHTVTMPCFGTTVRTKSNAEKLSEAYGTSFYDIDITKAVRQHFSDIGHDESLTNITYENSQARERTQILMDLSNKFNGLVIGTGDLSELALGWATYNGDHMSMYAVNVSIPKTLVRYITAYEAQKSPEPLRSVLNDILNTPVSPELLPPDDDGKISQKTEELVGPYELHDFFLYYLVRFGFSPSKIYYIAVKAFDGKYTKETIKKWLVTFLRRFFTQQFKRSCLPDGPKVGSVTLSPRSDWRMPSDATVQMWLDELEKQ